MPSRVLVQHLEHSSRCIPLNSMCWTEHTTRIFACGAAPGSIGPLAPDLPNTSTTRRYRCGLHRRAQQRYQAYCEDQGRLHLQPLSMPQWAAQYRIQYCAEQKTYMATWRTQRHCTSGLNGQPTCNQMNVPHTYPNAPGGEAVPPGYIIVRL
jgi:hypothetical protein